LTNKVLGRLEVAQILENFLQGAGGPWDWDDFISVGNVADDRLKQIQRHVNLLSDEFPPEKPGEYCNEQAATSSGATSRNFGARE
jgi:hypothetical protein